MKKALVLIATALVALPVALNAQTTGPSAPVDASRPVESAKPAKPAKSTLRAKVKRKLGKGTNTTPIGENPSYPAPARDGSATK